MTFLARLLQKWSFGWQSLNTFCSFPLHASPQETSSTAAPPPMNVRSPNAEGSPAKPAASWSVWPSAWCEKVSDKKGSGRGSKWTFYPLSDCISHSIYYSEKMYWFLWGGRKVEQVWNKVKVETEGPVGLLPWGPLTVSQTPSFVSASRPSSN